ncbi:hypothetical protein AJ78_08075 [Emergomyces pasteurianus Ep9510]|uniref:Uncharacterized protein n=1 Tax=Emergomyces pasteurianus Ep9510 TaxID=1447872 RepID=A0A1J9PT81_9EURO|nr:hypothetical protein AJ78_08075 [Emergomyces pasteurianus Ep9510]
MAVFPAYRPASPRLMRPPPAMSGMTLVACIVIFFLFCSFANHCFSSFLDSVSYDSSWRDREIVVASMSTDNTSWLNENLPEWKKKVYVVDDPKARLTVPKNKGREAMVYLTYIIDNYHNLPKFMVFIHSQRYQWHSDDPLYDSVPPIENLQLPFLSKVGYANLRCVWLIGCPAEIRPFTDIARQDVHAGVHFKSSFEELFPGSPVPKKVGVPCCAQFAATRDQVHKRPKEEYEHYRNWLLNTSLSDEMSGRIFEYSWHMIFGRNSVHCPSARECYCKQFGFCNLSCTGPGSCDGRYTMPPYSTLPKGWPDIGWDGKPRSPSDPLPAREPPKQLLLQGQRQQNQRQRMLE